LRAKPAAAGGTMTYADTGCDWLKQLKTFHGCFSVLFWLKQNSFETLVQFCYAVSFHCADSFIG